jgi:hypothetical protein
MTASDDSTTAEDRAREHHEAHEKAAEEMREFEQADEVPKDPGDWPSGKAKYITYGSESDEAYGEGNTAKLGPSDVVHGEDGSVTVGGEQVDDPSEFKGEPIKGGVIEQIEASKQRYRDQGDGSSDDGDGDGG